MRVLWHGGLWSKTDAEGNQQPERRGAGSTAAPAPGSAWTECGQLGWWIEARGGPHGRLGRLGKGKAPVLRRTFRNKAVFVFR